MRRLFVVVSTVLSIVALPALAQGTAKQKAACERDSHKYCASAEPDAIAVEKCLKEHMPSLSKACQRQFGKGRR